MINIRVVTDGLDKFISGLSSFITDMNNRKEVMQDIKQQQIERWSQNFAGEGSEYEPWAESSVFTQEDRIEEGFAPQPTLMRAGALLTHFDMQNHAGKVTNSAITWDFTNRIGGKSGGGAYTVSHHTGYSLRGVKVPARVLWDLDQEDQDRGQAEIEEWLDGLAAKHF